MTKRDFFIMIIKVFGLYWVVNLLFRLPSNFAYVIMDKPTPFTVFWLLLSTFFGIGLFVLLISNAGNIVRLLKLEKRFDDDRIEFGNLKASDIVKIGTFIIGGLLLLDSIPVFLKYLLVAFDKEIASQVTESNIYNPLDKFYLIISSVKIVLGYLLLKNYDFMANRFDNKTDL